MRPAPAADLRRTENEIAYKVKELYYAILATERRRNAVDAQIRAAQLRNTETRNAVVTGVSLEVNAAEVKAQIAQATHVQRATAGRRHEYEGGTGRSLRVARGCRSGIDQTRRRVTAVSMDAEGAVNAAYAHNPEVEAAAHQVEKARAALRAARAEYIPDVGAFAQHIYQDGAPFLSRNNGAFGVHMTWTIFEFGKRRGQVSERAAEVSQAEENLARLKNRVRIDVEKAVRKLSRAETGVGSARESGGSDNRSTARIGRSGGDRDGEPVRLPGIGGFDVERAGGSAASGVRPQRGGRGPYATSGNQ